MSPRLLEHDSNLQQLPDGPFVMKKLAWRAIPFGEGWEDEPPDEVIWADLARLDAAWRCTAKWIGPGGAGQQGQRYTNFGLWLKQGLVVEMCCISLSDGEVSFVNGRHRFAWLRDHHVVAIPVQVPAGSAAEFRQRFETDLQESVIPSP
jgi:hypothetical protein